ncbi:MAG: hypothetical protein ACU843_05840 [Gammaproteobacteria bacterium]
MSIRRVLTVLLFVGIFFGPLIAANIWNALSIRDASDQYRRASFVVTGSNCIGGQRSIGRDGSTTTSPVYCFLEGTIDGTAEELPVSKTDIPGFPSGTEIAVWYAPDLSPFGVNYQPLRVLRDQGEPPATNAEALLAGWYQLPLRFSIFVILFELLYTFTAGPFWRERESGALVVVEDGALVGLGYAIAGIGLTVLSFEVSAGLSLGSTVFSLAATAVGLLLCARRVHRIERKPATLSTRRGFWPVFLPVSATDLARPPRVSLEQTSPRGPARIFVNTERGAQCLLSTSDIDRAVVVAHRLADLLRQPLDERWPEDENGRVLDVQTQRQERRREARRRWRGRLAGLLFLGVIAGLVAATVLKPELSAPLWQKALARDMEDLPTVLRTFAAKQLAVSSKGEVVLSLLWTANTASPDWQAELGKAALASLEKIAGRRFEGADRAGRLRALNAWAATRLGRRLDAHGGVLTWFEPLPRWRDLVEVIASPDVHSAWANWDLFAAGDLTSSYQFAGALGSALTDPRPIAFAIKRGSFLSGPGPDSPAFEGQPEPIEEHADRVLVRTVAGALALKMWQFNDVPSDGLPEDFAAWWNAFAKSRLYPPLPEAP